MTYPELIALESGIPIVVAGLLWQSSGLLQVLFNSSQREDGLCFLHPAAAALQGDRVVAPSSKRAWTAVGMAPIGVCAPFSIKVK